MKARSVLGLGALLALCLAAGPALGQESFAKLVGDVKVGDVKKADTLEVPFILWGGDVATFVANGGLETKPGTTFEKQGLKLKLTPGDDFVAQVKNYMEGKTPFLRGTLSMLGQASEVIGSDPKTKPVVFLQLTWSAGDHMVARGEALEKEKLAGLKGKKIALQQGGPHVGMLDDTLRTAKLTWNDIKVVWTKDVTGKDGPGELFKKDPTIDACFVISPDMQGLTGGLKNKGTGAEGTVKGAFVLNSTVYMGQSIADVYACRKDFYDANKALVEKFASSYLKGCEDLLDMKKKNDAEYKKVLKMTQDIYGKEAIPSDTDADGLISDATFVLLKGNVEFFKDPGNTVGFKEKQKAALELAIALKNASKKIEFIEPTLDYDNVKKLTALRSTVPTDFTKVTPKIDPEKIGKIETPAPDNTIYSFDIYFEPDQDKFEEAKYGEHFDKAVRDAALFSSSVVAVRGHADLAKLLSDFVKAGMDKNLVKRTGTVGNFKYFEKDGTTPIDLGDTAGVIKRIKDWDFTGASENPKATLKALEDLSTARADTVRQSVIKYAEGHKLRLDTSQLKFVGVGATEPFVPLPRKPEEMAKNRRVEFRIIKVPAEAVKEIDF